MTAEDKPARRTRPRKRECDALVTAERGSAPLLLHGGLRARPAAATARHGVAAAAHCGWRSSVADILAAVVERDALPSAREPGDIRAAFGPAIGRCCFETDGDVPHALQRLPRPGRGGSIICPRRARGQVPRGPARGQRAPPRAARRADGGTSPSPASAPCATAKNTGRTGMSAAAARGSQCAVITL